MPKFPEAELLNIFGKFFKDEQDSVRMQGIDSCVVFAKNLPQAVKNIFLSLYRKSLLTSSLTLKSLLRIKAGG